MENENPFEDGWVSNNNRFVDSNGNTTYVTFIKLGDT